MLVAVGLSQIFFPTQNLERVYQVDKELEAVLWCLKYHQSEASKTEVTINKNMEQKFKFYSKV